MAYYRKLEGEQVYLSPLSPDDAPAFTKWMADPAVSGTLGNLHCLFSETGEREYLERAAKDEREYQFAIVRKSNDVLLGSCGIMDIHNAHRAAMLGIFIGDAGGRGRGYGTDAMRLLAGYAFRQLNMHSLWLHVHADNPAAVRCYEKVGFKEAGRRREAVFRDGRYIDLLYMDMLANEF